MFFLLNILTCTLQSIGVHTVVYKLVMDVGDFKIKLPTSFIVCGSSQSGKSTLVQTLLKNQENVFNNSPYNKPYIILFYAVYQPIYTNLVQSGIVNKIVHGVPPLNEFEQTIAPYKQSGGCITIFDDLGGEISSRASDFEKINTVFVHHYR